MSTMDDAHRELQQFARELEKFNGALQSSVAALTREHQRVSGLWQDQFRKEYDTRWNEFARHMESYQGRDAQRYASFLKTKIRQLGRYLNG